jgi:CO dehydrogenase maturation factor
MKGIISICGKGGVGKTTLAALLSRLVLEEKNSRGLAIDADPAGGLSLALSLPIKKTVNDLRKSVIASIKTHSTDSLNLAASIDYQLLEALSEYRNLAFLAVGRPEEEGCYCQVNTFLREAIEIMAGHFDLVLIDAEAGVEQVNRRVMGQIDLLLLVSDLSAKGLRVAETIKQVADEAMQYRSAGLLINRVRSKKELAEVRQYTHLPLIGWLPEDQRVRQFDMAGRSFLELPDCPSLQAVRKLSRSLIV